MLPRYVLVLDDDDRLVGVVSRRELLKGLIPHLHEDREAAAHIKELVPFGGSMPSDVAIRWTSLFSRSASQRAAVLILLGKVPGISHPRESTYRLREAYRAAALPPRPRYASGTS